MCEKLSIFGERLRDTLSQISEKVCLLFRGAVKRARVQIVNKKLGKKNKIEIMGISQDFQNFYTKNQDIGNIFGTILLIPSDSEGLLFHKIMLATKSEIFHEMLKENTKESIEIPELTHEDMKTFHNYLYTDILPLESANFKIIGFANKFGLVDLHEKCVKLLERKFMKNSPTFTENRETENSSKELEHLPENPEFDQDENNLVIKEIKKFKCDLCLRHFMSKYSAKKHKKLAHEKHNSKFKCEHCEECFHSQARLKSHLSKIHGIEEKFECNICGNEFNFERNLKSHVSRIHESDTFYKCEIPDCTFKGTSRKGILDKHVKSHRKCDICGLTFLSNRSKRDYERHLKSHTPKPPKVTPKCELCGKEYPYKSYVEKHLINCTKIMAQKEELRKVQQILYPMDEIPEWDKYSVKTPIKIEPKAEPQIEYECSFCGKSFQYRSYCEKHIVNCAKKVENLTSISF